MSRPTLDPAVPSLFSPTGLSPSLAGFPKTILLTFAVTFAVRNPVALAPRFRLLRVRSPLLTESMFLSFPPGTEMFQFPGFPSIRYGLAYGYQRSALMGFPIRKSPDRRIFAPPRSFSQLVTSFIGPQCLGIHPAPFMLDLVSAACLL